MASKSTSSRRTPGESVLTGGRTIRKARSRSSSLGPRPGTVQQPAQPSLLDFLDNILKFSKALLRQKQNPLRSNLPLSLPEALEASDDPVDTTRVQTNHSGVSGAGIEDWSERCFAIKTELSRLVVWKFDVTQKKLSPAMEEESPVYSVICESMLGIGEILVSLTSTQYISSATDPLLQSLYRTVERSIEHFRSRPNSTAVEEQPSANTRLRKSAVDGVEERVLLQMLRSDIKRLVQLVQTMATVARQTDVYGTT